MACVDILDIMERLRVPYFTVSMSQRTGWQHTATISRLEQQGWVHIGPLEGVSVRSTSGAMLQVDRRMAKQGWRGFALLKAFDRNVAPRGMRRRVDCSGKQHRSGLWGQSPRSFATCLWDVSEA